MMTFKVNVRLQDGDVLSLWVKLADAHKVKEQLDAIMREEGLVGVINTDQIASEISHIWQSPAVLARDSFICKEMDNLGSVSSKPSESLVEYHELR